MRELNGLIYSAIKNDAEFQLYTGGSTSDPRIYKTRTPVKISISDTKPAYAVYYKAGSIRLPSEASIHGASRNDYTFVVEVYSKKDTTVESICHRLERLFDGQRLQSTTFIVGYTYASRGQISWDEARQLYLETVTVHFTHIITLNEAS